MSERVEYIPAKTIVLRTKDTSWFGTQYNMNIYRGCSHVCICCDSRSDCYHNDRFDQVRVKACARRGVLYSMGRIAGAVRPISSACFEDSYTEAYAPSQTILR